jgi:two-component system CheB/CheR fusion protein
LIDDQHIAASVRIWVPGCSSGEEVYSIAICLLEYLGGREILTHAELLRSEIDRMSLA